MTPFYVTTPIYYVNDRPHIGHCYTTLLADVLARFHRLARGLPMTPSPAPAQSGSGSGPGDAGPSVFFLTGTDEHAEKVVTTAAERGLGTMQWADQNSAAFQSVFRELDYTFDDFIRTTQDRHKQAVGRYIAQLIATGDVEQGEYEGWYDVNAEAYVTETKAKDASYLGDNGKPLVRRKERNWYFALKKYEPWLRSAIESGELRIEPEARRNEVLGRLREGLDNVPISRPITDDPATQFGIRMPNDPSHRIYVWIDALFNYLSAVDTPGRRALWSSDCRPVHLMGKEILWFHAVIWPAILKALRQPLPRLIYAHSHYTRDGKKMSKSLGNFIDLETIRAYTGRYGVDALRWYLLTQGPLHATDADFSHEKFIEVYNADLANGVGNCASRVGNMIEKYFAGRVPDATDPGDWPVRCRDAVARAIAAAERAEPAGAVTPGLELVRQVDLHIADTRPFTLAKDMAANGPRVASILRNCAETLRIASLLLAPAIPAKMAQLWQAWGCAPAAGVPLEQLAAFGGPHALKPGQALAKGEALFMRADPAEPAPKPVP